MNKNFRFLVLITVASMSYSQLERVITPDVTILDEKPSLDTGQITVMPNKTVIIKTLEGENVILICNVFNMFSQARIIWRRVDLNGSQIETVNDGLMSRDMSRWKIGQGKQTNSIRLEILSIDRSYEGRYTCDCQYSGSVEPARAERILYVVSKPEIMNFHSSYATTVNEGDRATLRCEASGIPTPVVFWRRTGGSSSLIRNYGETKPGNLLTFDAVLPEDAGEYLCRADNELGSAFWPVQLYVRHAPRLSIYTVVPAPSFSCNLQLLCEVAANPASEVGFIKWLDLAGQPIAQSSRLKTVYLNSGTTRFLALSFEPITASDLQKSYTCLASNTLGTASRSFILTEENAMPGLQVAGLRCSAVHSLQTWIFTELAFIFFCPLFLQAIY